jgi:hypothetical protein
MTENSQYTLCIYKNSCLKLAAYGLEHYLKAPEVADDGREEKSLGRPMPPDRPWPTHPSARASIESELNVEVQKFSSRGYSHRQTQTDTDSDRKTHTYTDRKIHTHTDTD